MILICFGFLFGFFSPSPVKPFTRYFSQVLRSFPEFMPHPLSSLRALSRFSTWLLCSRTTWEVCIFHTSTSLSDLEVGQWVPKLLRREKWEWAEWQAIWWQQLHFFWKPDKNRCLHILNAKIKWKATFLGFRTKRKPDVSGLFSLVLQRRVALSISCFLCHGLSLFPLVFKCT